MPVKPSLSIQLVGALQRAVGDRRLLAMAVLGVLLVLAWRRVRDFLVGVTVFGAVFVSASLDGETPASPAHEPPRPAAVVDDTCRLRA